MPYADVQVMHAGWGEGFFCVGWAYLGCVFLYRLVRYGTKRGLMHGVDVKETLGLVQCVPRGAVLHKEQTTIHIHVLDRNDQGIRVIGVECARRGPTYMQSRLIKIPQTEIGRLAEYLEEAVRQIDGDR
jgi:hypothetical protein